MYENFSVIHLGKEKKGPQVLDEKSIPASKIEVSRGIRHTWFLLGS
jgi:hypothetical protein